MSQVFLPQPMTIAEAGLPKVLLADDTSLDRAEIEKALMGVAEVVDAQTASPLPPGFIRTRDGKVIPRDKAVFLLRDHEEDGKSYKIASDRAYESGPRGQLRRVGPAKLSKAEKKRLKREKRKGS